MWLEYARLQSIWKIWIRCLVGYSMRVLELAWIRANSLVTPYLCWDGPVVRELRDTPTCRPSRSSTSCVITVLKSATIVETLTAMAEYLRLDCLIS